MTVVESSDQTDQEALASRTAKATQERCQKYPLAYLLIGLTSLALGSLGLTWSVHVSAIFRALLSVAVIVGGLLAVNDWMRASLRKDQSRSLKYGGVGLAVAGIVLLLAIVADQAWIASIGVCIGILAALPTHLGLRLLARHRPLVWVLVGALVSATGGMAAQMGLPVGISLVLLLSGIVAYKYGLGWWVPKEDARWQAVLGGLVTGSGVGLGIVGSRTSNLSLFLVATWLVVLGLHLASAAWPSVDLAPLDRRTIRIIGVLFIIAGVFVTWSSGLTDLASWLIGLFVASLGGSIVWRGDGMVIFVGIAFVMVWVLIDRTTTEAPDPHPNAEDRLVVFGDSYISGEGAEKYLEGTNDVGEKENQCRRAATAYPWLVADAMEMGLDFYACSGAKTINVVETVDGGEPQMETSVDAIFGNRLQINNLPSPDERGNIAAAVVSIGGNDANFSEVAKGCLVPGSCDELRELWLGNLEAIGPRLRDTYREIKMALPGVPIVVVPYPLMLTEEGCGWSLLDEREHTFLSEFVTALNEQVRVAAAREGVNFVTEAMFAFEDNRICDGDDADSTVMNFVNLRPTGGSFGERLNPGNWVHGSMHPKPSGHVETARVVERWLRDHLANVEGGAAANPAPLPNTKLEVLSLRGQVAVLIDAKALNLPVDLECSIAIAGEGDAVIDPFGTRIPVIDDPRAYPAPVRITDADATAPVCVTSADTGEWIVLPQSANAPVQIKLTPPTYLTVSGEDEDTQSVLYRSSDGTWQVRLIQYCSRNDRCASSVSAWMNGQLASAGRTAAPAFVLLILGGWLFAVASSPKSFFRSWRLNAEEAVDAFNTDRSEVGR